MLGIDTAAAVAGVVAALTTHRAMSLIHCREAAAAYLLAYNIVAYALAVFAVTMAIAFLLAVALGHGGNRGRARGVRGLQWVRNDG